MSKRSPTARLCYATCPPGLENILSWEAEKVGLEGIRRGRGRISFQNKGNSALKAVLWLRTAHRILEHLFRFPARTRDELYAGVSEFPWEDWLDKETTFAVQTVGTTEQLHHTHYSSLIVKDAIVDRLTQRTGGRPDVDPQAPVFLIVCHLDEDYCTLSLDTDGHRLHQRGYRRIPVEAPIRETLAAALLLWSRWSVHTDLFDPFCGSGTLAIEAAMMAHNIAPGRRRNPACLEWPRQQRMQQWVQLCADADARIVEQTEGVIAASDRAPDAIAATLANAEAAEVRRWLTCSVSDSRRVDYLGTGGLIIGNPPYGERLSTFRQAQELLEQTIETIGRKCDHSAMFIVPNDMDLPFEAHRWLMVRNGPIDCKAVYLEQTPQTNRRIAIRSTKEPSSNRTSRTSRPSSTKPLRW